MMRLEVWLDRDRVGWLTHDGGSKRFALKYAPQWKAGGRSFPISPRLPLDLDPKTTAEAHSSEVRLCFENLLPEGEALDHAAQVSGVSKANLVGLMIALGKETAGALRIFPVCDDPDGHHDGDLQPAMPMVRVIGAPAGCVVASWHRATRHYPTTSQCAAQRTWKQARERGAHPATQTARDMAR